MTDRRLGVCYYPEHWPEDRWPEDAARMARAGIGVVRIGEFAWSRLEPSPGDFRFDWLDRAMDTLGRAGLSVVLGTPSATPPRWMLDLYPDMVPVDAAGRPRGFGSRRHYDFAHAGYRAEAARMAERLARRYGRHGALAAWQTDNEYGCHDTTQAFGPVAARAFRDWLAARYGSVEALNAAWGNVFWSMEYQDFAQIAPPNLTVTEPNPAHAMDWHRFASDQVVAFNRAQVAAIRAHSDRPILHNYMGRITDFDHWQVGADLDIATWDSYPIGFLSDRLEADPDHKRRFLRQGDPDFQAFHHDLYRGVGRGRWWVMEQQPGPVNWAPWNPAPLPGMVRLWTWEAFAHGAEVVSYFRWRQAPFAQEQMHAGLLRPDGAPAPALAEVETVAAELSALDPGAPVRGDVAIVFDYASAWATKIQPQGADFDYFRLVFDTYRAFRRAGLSVDVIGPETADLSPWALVAMPGLFTLSPALAAALARVAAQPSDTAAPTRILAGPRTNWRTPDFAIPEPLPPALPGLDLRVARVESLPPSAPVPVRGGGALVRWFEHLEGTATVTLATADGAPAAVESGAITYLAGWPDEALFDRLVAGLAARQGLRTSAMPDGLRRRRTAAGDVLLNYAPEPREHAGRTVPAAGVLLPGT